jgi:hypothetical protein
VTGPGGCAPVRRPVEARPRADIDVTVPATACVSQ